MDPLIFLYTKIKRNEFLLKTRERIILFLIYILFFIGLFYGSRYLFDKVMSIPVFGEILLSRIINLTFLMFMVLILFSSLFLSVEYFYSSKDMELLFSYPIKPFSIYSKIIFEITISSSQTTILFLLPIILSLASYFHYPIYIFISPFFLFLFFLLVSTISTTISHIILKITPREKVRNFLIVLFITIFSLLYLTLVFIKPITLYRLNLKDILLNYLLKLKMKEISILPSTWISNLLIYSLLRKPREISIEATKLLFSSLIFYLLSLKTTDKLLKRNLYKGGGMRRGRSVRDLFISRLFKGVKGEIMKKDILLLLRTPSEWSEVILILALVIVYIANFSKLSLLPYFKPIFSQFNFLLISFILSSLSLRFPYTQISKEGRGFVLLKSFPINLKEFMLSKVYLYSIFLIPLSGLLNFFVNHIGGIEIIKTMSFTSLSLLNTLELIFISVGFGSIYIKPDATSYGEILSSAGSIVCMVLSMVISGINVLGISLISKNPLSLLILLIPIFVAYFIFNLGYRRLKEVSI